MNSRKRNVRFPQWIHDEIEVIAEEKGKTFTDVVTFLLEDELNHLGYSKVMWESKQMGIGRGSEKVSEGRKKGTA